MKTDTTEITDTTDTTETTDTTDTTDVDQLVQVCGGPSTYTMYITALYFCMTCMTSIGFGNVAADTDSEKVDNRVSGLSILLLQAARFNCYSAKFSEQTNPLKKLEFLR